MTIQDWGSIGEIVGAVGVIASLLYLAAQIRQNSRIARISATQHILGVSAQMNAQFAGDVSEVFGKLTSGATLTPAEESRYFAMLFAVFAQHWQVYYQHCQGMTDREIFDTYERRTLSILGFPRAKDWWSSNSSRFGAEFASYVNSLASHAA